MDRQEEKRGGYLGMSYDISFRVKVEGTDAYIPVGECEAMLHGMYGK